LGVPANQPIDLRDPVVKGRVLDAIFAFENSPQAMQAAGAPSVGPLRPELPQGQGDFMKNQATEAGKRYAETIEVARDAPTRINVLDNIINLSNSGVQTGPNAAWWNRVKGSAAYFLPGDKKNISDFQEMQKFMVQSGMRAWAAAGGTGTDAQLEQAMHANPNDAMFPHALQTVSKWIKAGETAAIGKANAQDRYLQLNGNTPQAQNNFEQVWRNSYDPRVFQLQGMVPQEQMAFVKGLSPADAGALLQKRQAMKGLGAIQ
jgi:hypothetical protein